ncbi:hypothetical protein FSP39_010158 [Pinctada imbricata]|uniref:Ig-like domain-containing protein n=1 Tax=Pinctada imbricata TaxID=66713 RepID=A0AA89BKS4_PINIB|nr:hypothetical protein FSP39_010158 [Pinctada imbricata]
MPEQTKAPLGGSKRFECRVVGFPRPTVQWFKDGRDITHDDRFEFDYSIDGVITMVIHNVTFKDQGVYSCRAENSEGWAATAAILNVRAIQGYIEKDTVHEMQFEIGGMKQDSSEINEGTGQLKIKSRYDDFISKIGGKGSIHDSMRSDFDINGDSNITDSKADAWKIDTTTNVNNVSDDTDTGSKGILREEQEESKAKDKDNMLRPSAKRRLSDLDVHLRMMNEKVAPFFDHSLEEERTMRRKVN